MLLIGVFGQVHFLSEGLKSFDALFIIPVFQCCHITFSIVRGAVFFEELASLDWLQWIVFCSAVMGTLLGVLLLSSGKYAADDEVEMDRAGTVRRLGRTMSKTFDAQPLIDDQPVSTTLSARRQFRRGTSFLDTEAGPMLGRVGVGAAVALADVKAQIGSSSITRSLTRQFSRKILSGDGVDETDEATRPLLSVDKVGKPDEAAARQQQPDSSRGLV